MSNERPYLIGFVGGPIGGTVRSEHSFGTVYFATDFETMEDVEYKLKGWGGPNLLLLAVTEEYAGLYLSDLFNQFLRDVHDRQSERK